MKIDIEVITPNNDLFTQTLHNHRRMREDMTGITEGPKPEGLAYSFAIVMSAHLFEVLEADKTRPLPQHMTLTIRRGFADEELFATVEGAILRCKTVDFEHTRNNFKYGLLSFMQKLAYVRKMYSDLSVSFADARCWVEPLDKAFIRPATILMGDGSMQDSRWVEEARFWADEQDPCLFRIKNPDAVPHDQELHLLCQRVAKARDKACENLKSSFENCIKWPYK